MNRTARVDAVATTALTLHSFVVAAAFVRVFDGWTFLTELGLVVVVGHGWSFAARRLRLDPRLTLVTSLVGLLWIAVVLRYGGTTTVGIPTQRTWERTLLELRTVGDQFATAVAPVPYAEGWAVLSIVGTVAIVLLSDTLAFRAGARAEALVPGTVLFVFVSALADDRFRRGSAVALVAASVIATGALRSYHDRTVELRPARRRIPLTGPAVVGSAVLVAVVAGIVGPRLPGADAAPVFETRGRSGVTTVVSPLVDIRSRLTGRSDEELLRVDADAPAYWRLTTLAEFDGRRFTLPRRPVEDMETADGAPTPELLIRQQVQVVGLGGRLVPAAPEPTAADGSRSGDRLDLRIDRSSSALLAPDDLRVGDLFRIASDQRIPDSETLRLASSSAPPDPIFTRLPDSLPTVVAQLATEVTAGASGPYEQALALQNWFRDPVEFSYSLEVQSGHGASAIELFLERRVGYCEQFAATFATMARTLGIPARVAVGFTPGVRGSDGWYRVLGRNAHAWPEVWFDGIGWLAFEPTPGRGVPGASSYTGVPAAQDEAGAADAVTTTVDPVVTTVDGSSVDDLGTSGPSTVTPDDGSSAVPSSVPSTVPSTVAAPSPASDAASTDDATTDAADRRPLGAWRVPLFVILAVGSLIGAGATIRTVVVRRARNRPADVRIMSAWVRACRAAAAIGVTGLPSTTPVEWATATAERLPIAGRPMASLAAVVDQVRYAPAGTVDTDRIGAYGVPLVRECEQWAEQVERLSADGSPVPVRLRRGIRRVFAPD